MRKIPCCQYAFASYSGRQVIHPMCIHRTMSVHAQRPRHARTTPGKQEMDMPIFAARVRLAVCTCFRHLRSNLTLFADRVICSRFALDNVFYSKEPREIGAPILPHIFRSLFACLPGIHRNASLLICKSFGGDLLPYALHKLFLHQLTHFAGVVQ